MLFVLAVVVYRHLKYVAMVMLQTLGIVPTINLLESHLRTLVHLKYYNISMICVYILIQHPYKSTLIYVGF